MTKCFGHFISFFPKWKRDEMPTQPTPREKTVVNRWTHFFTCKLIRTSFRNAVFLFRMPDIGHSPNYVHSESQLCDHRMWENEGGVGVRLSRASILYTLAKLSPEL